MILRNSWKYSLISERWCKTNQQPLFKNNSILLSSLHVSEIEGTADKGEENLTRHSAEKQV